VRFWMSGYYNAAANKTVLDYSRWQKIRQRSQLTAKAQV
jgi:hypothetical protein